MSNVAYADFGAIKAPVERKVAELEDGYAKLSNMLLEAYAGADLTKRQFKVLLAILRKTYGWNKAMDRISDSQIAEIAKLPVKRCNETKLQLVRMGLIKQQGGMFGPNKNINEWFIPQIEVVSLKTGDKTSLKSRESHPSKQGDTKDTIQKKEIQDKNTMPEQVQAKQKKSSDQHEETDQAFENIFWCAGMHKTGKKNAKSAFRTQFTLWRKDTKGSAGEFARFLADDIKLRLGVQFGFDKLHPSTYLNGQRWNDEKPATAVQQVNKSSAITVSKTGLVFWDR